MKAATGLKWKGGKGNELKEQPITQQKQQPITEEYNQTDTVKGYREGGNTMVRGKINEIKNRF